MVTPKALRYPRLISEATRAGHRVEFHCVEHVRHAERTRGEIEEDVRVGLRELHSLGIKPRLWRTPWGDTTSCTEEVANRFGLKIAHWTADTHDWRGDSTDEMLEAIEPLLEPGAVVLMHDGLGPGARRANCGETTALIEPLVNRIRALGCEPTAMDPISKATPA